MAKFGSDYQALAHHWIYSNDYSECYGTRMFSENNKIYSYGYHYIIAQKLVVNEERVYLINSDTYSNTTTKHKTCVRNAIPYNSITFEIPGAELNHDNNINYYLREIEYYADKESRAKKIDYKSDIIYNIDKLKSYIDIFKYDKRKITKLTKQILDFDLEYNIQDLIEILTDIRNNKVRIAEKKKRLLNKKVLEKAKADLCKWLNFEIDYLNYNYIDKIYLRYNQNEELIETSNSSAITLEEAKLLHSKVKRAEKLLGDKVGSYSIVEAGKVFKIGCTELTRDVMNDMCKQLNLEEVF